LIMVRILTAGTSKIEGPNGSAADRARKDDVTETDVTETRESGCR
jgi:hypothetical protein